MENGSRAIDRTAPPRAKYIEIEKKGKLLTDEARASKFFRCPLKRCHTHKLYAQ